MEDIKTKEDILALVNDFYTNALKDPVIGPVFKAADFSLEKHIPVMVSFWETILLDIHTYKGNPMLKHIELNQMVPLLQIHFERWMKIWKETVFKKFKGERALEAVNRASSIAQMMQFKINRLSGLE